MRLVSDTGLSSTDKITSDPTIAGWGDPNAVVYFAVDGTPIAATATADGSGEWTFTPTGLIDGTHTLVAMETDTAGNTGTASLTFMLDTTAPVMTESLKNDTGSSSSDKITKDPTLTGSGDPNAVVNFTVDGTPITAKATADNFGHWTFNPTGLSDGQHTVIASETDAAGNTGTATLTFTLHTTPPVDVITSDTLNQNGSFTLKKGPRKLGTPSRFTTDRRCLGQRLLAAMACGVLRPMRCRKLSFTVSRPLRRMWPVTSVKVLGLRYTVPRQRIPYTARPEMTS
jgi:hypothetical protein